MKYDYDMVELVGGYFYNYGQSETQAYNLELYFYTDGLSIENRSQTLSGEGNLLYFEVYSPYNDQIIEGSYNLSASYHAGTYASGMLAFGYSSNETYDYVDIIDGTLTVEHDGTDYIFSFEGVTEEDIDITAYYRGSIKVLSD